MSALVVDVKTRIERAQRAKKFVEVLGFDPETAWALAADHELRFIDATQLLAVPACQ